MIKNTNRATCYMLHATNSKGFTLIELLVTIGIFAIILAGSWVAYLNFQRSTSLSSYSSQVLSLIYQAQNQAMERMCTEGCDTAQEGQDFGVYFDDVNDKVTLFRNASYNPSDTYNISVQLPSNLDLNANLGANKTIVFDKFTGNVRSYNESANTFSISETNEGLNKNFNVNGLGVIDVVN